MEFFMKISKHFATAFLVACALFAHTAQASIHRETLVSAGFGNEIKYVHIDGENIGHNNVNFSNQMGLYYGQDVGRYNDHYLDIGIMGAVGNKVNFIVWDNDSYLAPTMDTFGYSEIMGTIRATKDEKYYQLGLGLTSDTEVFKPIAMAGFGFDLNKALKFDVQMKMDGGINKSHCCGTKDGYLETAITVGLRLAA